MKTSGVICSMPKEKFGYFGWPSIARQADGTLIVAASGFRNQHVCPWGRTVVCKSHDDGATWSAPIVVNNTPLDDRDAGVISLGDSNGQVAKVVLNGREIGTLWCEPYEILLAEGALREGENVLEVEFTNVWANRLIGDEHEPPDCDFAEAPLPGGRYLKRFPEWFKGGLESRPSKGRKCFTDWNYFTKDSPLVPSGLLGPVLIKDF